jgi:hypothetical protein
MRLLQHLLMSLFNTLHLLITKFDHSICTHMMVFYHNTSLAYECHHIPINFLWCNWARCVFVDFDQTIITTLMVDLQQDPKSGQPHLALALTPLEKLSKGNKKPTHPLLAKPPVNVVVTPRWNLQMQGYKWQM